MKDEELGFEEEIETEEDAEEESVQSVQKGKQAKSQKLELDFNMDSSERLSKEIEFTDDYSKKAIGEFLLNEFTKDEVLKADYKARKLTLDKIFDFVKHEAKKRVKSQSGAQCVMISDTEVFGLVIHCVHDGEIKEDKSDKYVLTKEAKKSLEEQAKEEYLTEQKRKLEEAEKKRIEKEKAARERALAKEKKEREESGQISLFDDFD